MICIEMKDKRALNGGNSTKAVRLDDKRLLSKTELQDAFLLLSPMSEKAIEVHKKALEEGERWAVELFYKYYFKLPVQVIDQTNINIDAGKLTDVEIKQINKNLENTY